MAEKKKLVKKKKPVHGLGIINEVVEWISDQTGNANSVTMKLEQFRPDHYSSESCHKLIDAGLNPKIYLYALDEDTRYKTFAKLTKRLGQRFNSLEDNVWFSPVDLKCEPDCPADCEDKQKKFLIGNGFKVEIIQDYGGNLLNLIGSGGFGTVYDGELHNKPIAAKYIDVTEQYREKIINFTGGTVNDKVGALFNHTASHSNLEANMYLKGELAHPNILQSSGFWIQCSELSKIELVIAMPKCDFNLNEWMKTQPFDFHQIQTFLVQMSEALEHLESKNISHRNFKPTNVLITGQSNPEAKLVDVGLANPEVNGLTPGFCSPEQLKNRSVVGKTDMYAFGITTILALFGTTIGMAIMFLPLSTIGDRSVDELKQNKIIAMAEKMLQYKPSDRPTFAQIRNQLQMLRPDSVNLTASIANCDIENIGQTMAELSLIDRSILVSEPYNLGNMMSVTTRDQPDSNLCWCFSTGIAIRAEFKKSIYKLHKDGEIDDNTARTAGLMADQMNNNNQLTNEIVCLIFPKSPKQDDGDTQTAILHKQVQNICGQTLVQRSGWKQLPTLVAICELIIANSRFTSIDDFELTFETLHHPQSASVEKVLDELMPLLGPDKTSWFKYNGKSFKVCTGTDGILLKILIRKYFTNIKSIRQLSIIMFTFRRIRWF